MKISEDFKKPFNILMFVLAAAAIALAIYFYFSDHRQRNIAYQITLPTSKIYDKDNATPTIKLIENDSIPIRENVYLLTGVIWNNGTLPITENEVRKPLAINLNCKKILDYRIVKQNDSEVACFKLIPVSDSSLRISWKYFDPNFGFRFQIMYIGKENPSFHLDGKVLDIKKFMEIDTKTLTIGTLLWAVLWTVILICIVFTLALSWSKLTIRGKILLFICLPLAVLFLIACFKGFNLYFLGKLPF